MTDFEKENIKGAGGSYVGRVTKNIILLKNSFLIFKFVCNNF